ncbi:MAG: hypothetical protein IJS10_00940, partial [Alphaproteobacteria bacterium]|nr:hypothetical protein [Alphaproteobacteria bacterium]
VESEETIDGKEKRLYDIIDVGWYTDKNEQGHIAWLDVDDAYLDKAYYTYNKKQMTVTLNIPDGVFLDKKCFKDMTVPYIDKDDKMFSIGIENDANAVAMLSENSEYMIADSHSITSVYLGLCANSKSSKIASMISNNDRLDNVSIGIESPKNTLTRCESLICQNESLSSAKVTIWSENLKSLEAIVKGTPKLTTAEIYISSKSVQSLSNLVDEQPNLEEILIDLKNKTQNLKEMQNIFTRCPKLSKVVYIATTDSETGKDFIRTEYKLGEDNSIRIKKGDMSKYHSPKKYTDVSFYKDNETYKEENEPVDSADDDY